MTKSSWQRAIDAAREVTSEKFKQVKAKAKKIDLEKRKTNSEALDVVESYLIDEDELSRSKLSRTINDSRTQYFTDLALSKKVALCMQTAISHYSQVRRNKKIVKDLKYKDLSEEIKSGLTECKFKSLKKIAIEHLRTRCYKAESLLCEMGGMVFSSETVYTKKRAIVWNVSKAILKIAVNATLLVTSGFPGSIAAITDGVGDLGGLSSEFSMLKNKKYVKRVEGIFKAMQTAWQELYKDTKDTKEMKTGFVNLTRSSSAFHPEKNILNLQKELAAAYRKAQIGALHPD